MAEHPDVSTAPKLAKRCHWPSDSSKRGKLVSERQIRYLLSLREEGQPSPTLDLITAVAAVFSLEAWQLLVDDRQLRAWMLERAFPDEEGRLRTPNDTTQKKLA